MELKQASVSITGRSVAVLIVPFMELKRFCDKILKFFITVS